LVSTICKQLTGIGSSPFPWFLLDWNLKNRIVTENENVATIRADRLVHNTPWYEFGVRENPLFTGDFTGDPLICEIGTLYKLSQSLVGSRSNTALHAALPPSKDREQCAVFRFSLHQNHSCRFDLFGSCRPRFRLVNSTGIISTRTSYCVSGGLHV
jgi:hypothetical protein